MGDKSAIEWTDATWNPVTGCTKVSPGCKYCYAERLAARLKAMGNPRYKDGFEGTLTWGPNIWQGVSVENPEYISRIAYLQTVPARVRFLSLEPLLDAIPNLPLKGIHWVIVGGESGPEHRPIRPEWVRSIRDQCRRQGIPFFFKQWGGLNSKDGGCMLEWRKWQQWPS